MNEKVSMNTDEFAHCLDRWGSDLKRWPAPEQETGKGLVLVSERARELLTEAQRLDQWLASGTEHQVSFGLERRILARIPRQDLLQRLVDWFSVALWRPASAAACSLLVGFSIGLAQPDLDDQAMLDDLSMLAFSATFEEFEDTQQERPDVR